MIAVTRFFPAPKWFHGPPSTLKLLERQTHTDRRGSNSRRSNSRQRCRLRIDRAAGTSSRREGVPAYELDRRPEIARAFAAQCDLGELSRLDTRRVRFFSTRLSQDRDRQGIRRDGRAGVGTALPHACGTPVWRILLRLACGSLRPTS